MTRPMTALAIVLAWPFFSFATVADEAEAELRLQTCANLLSDVSHAATVYTIYDPRVREELGVEHEVAILHTWPVGAFEEILTFVPISRGQLAHRGDLDYVDGTEIRHLKIPKGHLGDVFQPAIALGAIPFELVFKEPKERPRANARTLRRGEIFLMHNRHYVVIGPAHERGEIEKAYRIAAFARRPRASDRSFRVTTMTYGRIARASDFKLLGLGNFNLRLPGGPPSRPMEMVFHRWLDPYAKIIDGVKFAKFQPRPGVNFL